MLPLSPSSLLLFSYAISWRRPPISFSPFRYYASADYGCYATYAAATWRNIYLAAAICAKARYAMLSRY